MKRRGSKGASRASTPNRSSSPPPPSSQDIPASSIDICNNNNNNTWNYMIDKIKQRLTFMNGTYEEEETEEAEES